MNISAKIAECYVGYLKEYSVAKHSVFISLQTCLLICGAMFLYRYLIDEVMLKRAESAKWAFGAVIVIWILTLLVVGCSLRYFSKVREEEWFVKVLQYGFSAVSVIIFLICLDVSNNKSVIGLILIFEIPALIFVVNYGFLSYMARVPIGWGTIISLSISIIMVTLGAIRMA